MLVNNTGTILTDHVKFIKYTGKWPCLCFGTLTLEIDGEEVVFGGENGSYGRFWESGGDCHMDLNTGDTDVRKGEWFIDVDGLPEKYKKYASEIDFVFNSNVSYGCCGGCL